MSTREDLLAAEAQRLRSHLLRVYRRHATLQDLEDIYAQSVLEVLARIRRDPTLATAAHIANTLRQRFESRLADHHRALGGRSAAALAHAHAARIDDPLAPLPGAVDVERGVLIREQLRETLHAVDRLSPTQRRALLADLLGHEPGCSGETQRKRLLRAGLAVVMEQERTLSGRLLKYAAI